MKGQWLPIVLAALPLVDLGFRLFLESISSGLADSQLDSSVRNEAREKIKQVVGNPIAFKVIRIYFENAVRIRQVLPTIGVATLSVCGAIEELAAKGPVSRTWNLAWMAYLSLSLLFLLTFVIALAKGKIKLSRDPEIKRRRIESPSFYNSVAFVFDFIAVVFAVVVKVSD
jgi:hypothetical protein